MNEESKPQCVAVVSQGLLGRGIAACFLRHGFAVVTIDRHEEQLADARQSIRQMMDELIERGDASPQVRHEWPQRFTATTNYAGLQECSFVVESVAEDLSVKAEALDAIEARLSPAVVIASNTSAIPITRLQHGRRHPARLVGMHWAAPAHATRFMELIRGEETSEEAMQVAARVARQIGKDVCVCQKDIPGFIVNRIAYAMYREAQHLLGTGVADADTIDRAVRNALGLWATLCGPLRWMDLTGGPELYAKAMQGVLPTLCNADTLSPLLQQLAASGAQGIRNGRGFFNYTPGEAQRWEELYRQHAWRVTEMQNEYFPPKSKDAP